MYILSLNACFCYFRYGHSDR